MKTPPRSAREILRTLNKTLETATTVAENLAFLEHDPAANTELVVHLESDDDGDGTFLDISRWVLPIAEVASGESREVCECVSISTREHVAWLVEQLTAALPYMLPAIGEVPAEIGARAKANQAAYKAIQIDLARRGLPEEFEERRFDGTFKLPETLAVSPRDLERGAELVEAELVEDDETKPPTIDDVRDEVFSTLFMRPFPLTTKEAWLAFCAEAWDKVSADEDAKATFKAAWDKAAETISPEKPPNA